MSFIFAKANSADLDQTAHNAVSDQDFHYYQIFVNAYLFCVCVCVFVCLFVCFLLLLFFFIFFLSS